MAARQEVEKAKEAVINAEGKLALSRKRKPAMALQHHTPTPPLLCPRFVQELSKLQSFVQVSVRGMRKEESEQVSPEEVEKTGLSLSTSSPDLVMLALTRHGNCMELSSLMETLIDRAESAVRSDPMSFT